MDDWTIVLVAFLFFVVLVAVGVVLIADDILRARAASRRATKRRLRQSNIKPSVPLPPPRPRPPVVMVARVAFALFMLSPVLVLGAAAVLAVMHLATQNPG